VHAWHTQNAVFPPSDPVASLLPPLSPAIPGALYEQIVTGIHAALANGQLPPGTPLPSVRQLAADTRVSVITVKRAYEELERDGLIYSKPGLGSFITNTALERSREKRLARARSLLAEARAEAEQAGLNPSEIQSLFISHLNP
jgi:GntR family transcriptional regulator